MSGGPSTNAAKITSGAVGTATANSTYFVRGVKPGEKWYFSYFYKATRVTGVNTATIVPTVDWYDATDTLLAGASTNGATQTLNATVGWTNPEDPHIAPASAVSAKVRYTVTPGGGTFQHDVYLTKTRFARTQVGSTLGAQSGPGGNLSGDVDGNLRPYVDFSQGGHTHRELVFTPGWNMVANGDCRLGKDYWSGATSSYTIDENQSGKYWHSNGAASLILNAPLQSQPSGTPNLQVASAAGDIFTGSIETNNSAGGNLYVRIQWFNASNTSLGTEDWTLSTARGFARDSHTFAAAPSTTSYFKLFVNTDSGTTGEVRWRRLKLEVGSFATPFTDSVTRSSDRLINAGTGYRVGDQRNLPALGTMNMRYRVTNASTGSTASLLSYTSTSTSATITIVATSVLIGTAPAVAYGSMTTASITNPGTAPNNATYHVYVVDPAYAGGTLTMTAVQDTTTGSTASNVMFQDDGKVYLGTITVGFPSSGGGSGSGGSGGGGSCVAEGEKVLTQRGWINAEDVVPGHHALRVLADDPDDGYEWALCESNDQDWELAYRLVGEETGVACIVSGSTPITLMDRVTDLDGINGEPLPFYSEDERWWECVRVEPVGLRRVRKIRVGGKTYVAGSVAGRGIATHNPKP